MADAIGMAITLPKALCECAMCTRHPPWVFEKLLGDMRLASYAYICTYSAYAQATDDDNGDDNWRVRTVKTLNPRISSEYSIFSTVFLAPAILVAIYAARLCQSNLICPRISAKQKKNARFYALCYIIIRDNIPALHKVGNNESVILKQCKDQSDSASTYERTSTQQRARVC